jgi:hypothetical protein
MSRSPDGTLVIEVEQHSEQSPSNAGMGHDPMDYFRNTTIMTVYEVASRKRVLSRSWSEDYDANSRISSSARPDSFAFSEDGRAVIVRFAKREERIELPGR